MKLDDTQRPKVVAWIEEGLTLSEIQKKLASELGLQLTYMEVRFLMDDLKLKPKDAEPPAKLSPPDLAKGSPAPPPPALASQSPFGSAPPPPTNDPLPDPTRSVSVTVDQLTRPGAVVSGKVTFPDGQKADWYLDQLGRLGMAAAQQGYRPSPQDLQEFQIELQDQLQRLGM